MVTADRGTAALVPYCKSNVWAAKRKVFSCPYLQDEGSLMVIFSWGMHAHIQDIKIGLNFSSCLPFKQFL